MNPGMRYGHGGQWTVKRNFPFLLSLTSGNQTTVSAVAAPTCSATCTSALALVTGKPYKYAWSDLLGDSKLGAGVNFVFIHSYMKGLGDPRGLFQPKYFSGSKTVWHSSVLPRVSNRGGHEMLFFTIASREGKIMLKFGNGRFSSSRGVQGVRRWDHAGFDIRLSYSWPVEHLLSVLHSFKVKYVPQEKYITLELGSFPPNTLCLGWRCLCQWWMSQYKWECAV